MARRDNIRGVKRGYRLVCGALALTTLFAAGAAPTAEPAIEGRITFISQVKVPGREPGMIIELNVKEGQYVTNKSVLGKIDNSEVSDAWLIKLREFEGAQMQAKNDVNIRFATESAKVAQAELEKSNQANSRSPNSIPNIEIQRQELNVIKAKLQIEQASLEHDVAIKTAQQKEAEVKAAKGGIERRTLYAPLDGMVTNVLRRPGEWVRAEDTVMEIVKLDKLRFTGYVDASQLSPSEIAGRDVVVSTELARGRTESFKGKIVFVSPRISAGNLYEVWAEVNNREEAGQWILVAGSRASMSIKLNAAATERKPDRVSQTNRR